MANRDEKRCSIALIIREMQIKTTVRCHRASVTVDVIKKIRNSKGWQGCGEMGTLFPVGKTVNWYSHCEKQYGDSSKTRNAIQPIKSAPEYLSEENVKNNS